MAQAASTTSTRVLLGAEWLTPKAAINTMVTPSHRITTIDVQVDHQGWTSLGCYAAPMHFCHPRSSETTTSCPPRPARVALRTSGDPGPGAV